MKLYGIERQTLLVALIPILMMAVLLENYFIYSRFADLDKALLERSQLMADQLASSSEYAVFSGDKTLLRQYVDAALTQRDVSRVMVLDGDAKQLMSDGRGEYDPLFDKVSASTPLYQDGEVLVLYEPILPTQIKLDELDHNADFSMPRQALGAIVIEISKSRLSQRKQEILLFNLLVTLLILMATMVVALWAARRVARPIMGMSEAIRRIGEGALDTRISPPPDVRELKSLATGINRMTQQLQQDRDVLEMRIAEATNELRRRSEAALQASEERLREIVDAMPISLFVKDAAFRIILMNHACEQQWGMTFSDLQGTDGSRFFPPEQLADFIAKDREIFAGGHGVDFEEEVWNAALRENRSVHTFKKPVLDMDGNPLYLIGVSLDITERKLSEEALRQLNENLELRIEQRTQELAHTKDMAEEANRAKGEFITNMSHEIRTPMNSVLGMTYLALRSETNPRQRDYLRKIQISGEHLLGIIDSILDFSKIDAGKLDMEVVDFNLDAVTENLTNLVSIKAEEKGLDLIFEIAPSIPRNLRGDPLRLVQVLVNFANNAIKFTQQGGVVIRARMIKEDDSEVLLRFEVQDTGIGMNEPEKSKLFQAFQQGDSSISRKYGGSGLGLVISKRLVMLMGGEVGVESEKGKGKGSTFWFEVLFGKGRQLSQSLTLGAQEKVDMEVIRGARVLLAEDSLFNQQVALEFLKDAGAIVSTANNGKEALDLLYRQHFDCVLMDMQMPVMDGLEAARLIRADAAMAGMPVIAMTANVSSEDRERCRAVGMDDFVSKPFRPRALYATLANWLSARASISKESFSPAAATMLAGDPGIIDLSVLAEMMDGHSGRITEFAHRFIASTRADMDEMQRALEHNDMATLGALGHRAKSPARMVGAMGFADLCQRLELCARNGDVEQAMDMIGQLHTLLQQISQRIEPM